MIFNEKHLILSGRDPSCSTDYGDYHFVNV